MQIPNLEELGLTSGQVKVYTAVLELGTAKIQSIQEKTALERRAIYDILNKLIEKGFVSYVLEKGIRRYQVTHPRHIKEQIDKMKNSLEVLEGKIPDITAFYESKRPIVGAEVLRGNDAMMALLDEALESDGVYWMGGNSGIERDTGPGMKQWFRHWMDRRAKLKVPMYDLVSYGTYLEDLKPEKTGLHKKQYYKFCSLPKGMYTPMVLLMFGNKVAQILWSKQSFAFVLESKEIRDSFMKYFNYFWRD